MSAKCPIIWEIRDQLALADNPDLARRHHLGEVDELESVVATLGIVDPGAALLAAIGVRMKSGLSEAQARAETFAAMPATVRAWSEGRPLTELHRPLGTARGVVVALMLT